MMQTETSPSLARGAGYIPWLIVGFFAVIACVLSTFVYVAVTTYRGVVTEQAYEKGVAYNDVILRAKEQDSRGWTSKIDVDGQRIIFALHDARGGVLEADTVSLLMFRPTQQGLDRAYTMHAQQGDAYAADISDLPAIGIWEARITAQTRQGEYHTSQRVVIK